MIIKNIIKMIIKNNNNNDKINSSNSTKVI